MSINNHTLDLLDRLVVESKPSDQAVILEMVSPVVRQFVRDTDSHLVDCSCSRCAAVNKMRDGLQFLAGRLP